MSIWGVGLDLVGLTHSQTLAVFWCFFCVVPIKWFSRNYWLPRNHPTFAGLGCALVVKVNGYLRVSLRQPPGSAGMSGLKEAQWWIIGTGINQSDGDQDGSNDWVLLYNQLDRIVIENDWNRPHSRICHRWHVTARQTPARVAIWWLFGEAMDFAAHALHVAMHEQMAQEPLQLGKGLGFLKPKTAPKAFCVLPFLQVDYIETSA